MIWSATFLMLASRSIALTPCFQGILNEVWKHKLIFVETPDANETSIALENYRRVNFSQLWPCDTAHHPFAWFRLAITDAVPCCSQWHEARYQKVSILITIMGALSSCLGV